MPRRTDKTDTKEGSMNQSQDSSIQPTEQKGEQALKEEMLEHLASFDDGVIKSNDNSKQVTVAQADEVLERIALFKGIEKRTAYQGFANLCRRGAANAAAPDSMEVEVHCKKTGVTTTMARYDIAMALQLVVGHKTVRKLAEALAPYMIAANLKLVEQRPELDLKGDLANRINRKLALKRETSKEDAPPLSRKEEICCSTYAQYLPNLNELAGSDRLKSLLDADLGARRKRKNSSAATKASGNPPSSGKK